MHKSDTGARSPNQDVQTPRDVLDAIESRFGIITCDLAAESSAVAVTPVRYITPEQDSLKVDWPTSGINFLNPPFNDIAPWAHKCRRWVETAEAGSRLIFFVPASVDSNWWQESVRGFARPLALRPRVKFVGHTQAFPKPIAVCVYDPMWPQQPALVEDWFWKRTFKVGSLARLPGLSDLLTVEEALPNDSGRSVSIVKCRDSSGVIADIQSNMLVPVGPQQQQQYGS